MFIVIGVVLPAIISVVVYQAQKRKAWAKAGELNSKYNKTKKNYLEF